MKTPVPHDRTKRFILRVGSEATNLFVGNLDAKTMENPLVNNKAAAMVLDWRDNESIKARFFSALLGVPVAAEAI